MRIAFISPQGKITNNKVLLRIWSEDAGARAYRDSISGIGTGLLTIASLTPSFFHKEFIDENLKEVDFNEHYDLVAISAMTQQANRAYRIADIFREKNVFVVIGGIHATILPDEAAKHADSVIVGEGENLWPVLMNDFLNKRTKKIYRSNALVNMGKSPIPQFGLLKPEHYKIIWIQASRGCPRNCSFCVVTKIYGSKCRHKTIKQVTEEIKHLKKISPQSHVGFADDNMFIDKQYAERLIRKIKSLDIRWFAQTDVSIANNPHLLKLLKEANCMSLFIGFESITGAALKGIDKYGWKAKQLERYPRAIEIIQSYGIGVAGAFIVGLDGDSKRVFNRLADFIIDNHVYAAQITVPAPLPGTRLREKLGSENRLIPAAWSNYTFTDVNFVPKNMTSRELEAGLEGIYKKVYSKNNTLEKGMYFRQIYKNMAKKRQRTS